jgi:hypothetical protein
MSRKLRGPRRDSRNFKEPVGGQSRVRKIHRRSSAPIILLSALGIATGILSGSFFRGEQVLAFLGDEARPTDDLSGLVIRPEDIPVDERGRPRPDLVLDLPAPEPMKPEIKQRLDELRARYEAEAASVPAGYFATRLAPPPDEANAPPRMDSGDPNPDRIVFHEASEAP